MPISPRGDPSSGGGRGFDDETAPERVDDPDDGAEARITFPVEAFIKAFAAAALTTVATVTV